MAAPARMDRFRRTALAVALGAALVLAVVLLASGGDETHTLKARFAAALDVTPGQRVRLAGSEVGSVEEVEAAGGGALVEMSIDDEVWPLPRDLEVNLRWGATTSYVGRFVQLVPGTEDGPTLPEGATVPVSQTTAPVEFDQMYTILDAHTRPRLQSMLGDLNTTLEGREQDLRSALERAPDGLQATSRFFEELGRDGFALRTLLRSGADATAAIARQDPRLRSLIVNAAGTFDEFADRARPIQATLDRLPGTLARTRAGLARLDGSIPGLRTLVDELRPGALRLQATAPALRRTVERLIDVAPQASRALREASKAAPDVTRLLTAGRPFADKAGVALGTAAPIVGCIRPYGPEIVGFFATWAGYTSRFNAAGHYARALGPVQPVPHGTPFTSEQALQQAPQLRYAMPRPPGHSVGQTWFQPQCGAGPDALDVSKDPEARK